MDFFYLRFCEPRRFQHLRFSGAFTLARRGWPYLDLGDFSGFEITKKCVGSWKSARECRNHSRNHTNQKFENFCVDIWSKLFFRSEKNIYFFRHRKNIEKKIRTFFSSKIRKIENLDFHWKSRFGENFFFTFQKFSKKIFFWNFQISLKKILENRFQ